jgi:antitoxin component YwqK of YwqJK toxin-antitoxin module
MPAPDPSPSREYLHYHQDGSLWAKGQIENGQPTGYWEWFRKNGVRLRSGHFVAGVQTGTWTTYDQQGAVYKVTEMKPKRPPRAKPGPAASA